MHDNITSILESKRCSHVNVIFLSSRASNKKSDTSLDVFEKAVTEKGHNFFVINPSKLQLQQVDDRHWSFNDEAVERVFDIADTVIVPRRTVLSSRASQDNMRILQLAGFFLVNKLDVFNVCEDKYSTYEKLKQQKVSTPVTCLCTKDSIDKALNKMRPYGFPLVGKLTAGTQGIGVFIMDSEMSARSVLQTLTAANPDNPIILQQYIKSSCDYRVHVLNKSYNPNDTNYEVIGMMKRSHGDSDFRSNYHLGASVSAVTEDTSSDIVKKIEEIAKEAARSVDAVWCGVDVILDEDNNPYVIEINSSPGTAGIISCGVDLMSKISGFICSYEWCPTNTQVGCVEAVDIESVTGATTSIPIAATFDTNEPLNTLTYYDIQFKPNNSNTKSITANLYLKPGQNPLTIEVLSAQQDEYSAYVNILFNHTRYKYVAVVLRPWKSADSESKGATLTLGCAFIERAGLAVTSSKYSITDPITSE